MTAVAASIVVNYGDTAASSALVVVELDDTLNLDAAGKTKTQFYPGDLVYFLVHHDATVRITRVLTTSGTVDPLGSVLRDRTQQMLFKSPTDKQDLPHLPAGIVTPSWYGRTSNLVQDGRSLTADATPCIGEMDYDMEAELFCLTPPDLDLAGDEKHFIGVVINMESVA
jgi:hypothetical protein